MYLEALAISLILGFQIPFFINLMHMRFFANPNVAEVKLIKFQF